MTRQVYAEVPVRVEYALTPLGGTMRSIVQAVGDWAEHTAGPISEARSAYDSRQPVARERECGYPKLVAGRQRGR